MRLSVAVFSLQLGFTILGFSVPLGNLVEPQILARLLHSAPGGWEGGVQGAREAEEPLSIRLRLWRVFHRLIIRYDTPKPCAFDRTRSAVFIFAVARLLTPNSR